MSLSMLLSCQLEYASYPGQTQLRKSKMCHKLCKCLLLLEDDTSNAKECSCSATSASSVAIFYDGDLTPLCVVTSTDLVFVSHPMGFVLATYWDVCGDWGTRKTQRNKMLFESPPEEGLSLFLGISVCSFDWIRNALKVDFNRNV